MIASGSKNNKQVNGHPAFYSVAETSLRGARNKAIWIRASRSETSNPLLSVFPLSAPKHCRIPTTLLGLCFCPAVGKISTQEAVMSSCDATLKSTSKPNGH